LCILTAILAVIALQSDENSIHLLVANRALSAFEITGNVESRLELHRQAWELFNSSPFIGNGVGSFQRMMVPNSLTGFQVVDAHSVYYTTLAETGLVGAAALGFLFARTAHWTVSAVVRTQSWEAWAVGAAAVVIAVTGLSGDLWERGSGHLFLVVLAGAWSLAGGAAYHERATTTG
jgi:O-antigen ligase